MTDDEKKRWLWRYRGSLEKEKALRADLQEQESRAVKTTAALTGMPGGGGDGHQHGGLAVADHSRGVGQIGHLAELQGDGAAGDLGAVDVVVELLLGDDG